MRALVTGASGFVGRAVAEALLERGWEVRAPVRRTPERLLSLCEYVVGYELTDPHVPAAWMAGCEVIVHAAARVHIVQESPGQEEAAHRAANERGTRALAQAAQEAGVNRFVFLSSVKVNGEETHPGCAFRESDVPAPADAYARSKLAAEETLHQVCLKGGMSYVVIRPPLVYGPGVEANFRALAKLAASGLPLPFGSVDNRRSLIALDNLVDFILVCMTHRNAANQMFLTADGDDLALPSLVRALANAAGTPARLVPVPPAWLRAVLVLTGREATARRLLGNLQVDISKARQLLGWIPPLRVEDALSLALQETAP